MKRKLVLAVAALLITGTGILVIIEKKYKRKKLSLLSILSAEKENEEARAEFQYQRWKYEFDMIKDPVTGTVPLRIQEREMEFAAKIPSIGVEGNAARLTALNSYLPAGPNNIGGRTRAVAYDKRYNGTTNRVLLAGSVSGGIMRSADGGSIWTRVSPENEIHNLSTIAQDPLNPDLWYAGGGEPYGNTASELGAPYLGSGLYKSINNGQTWSKIQGAGLLEAFDDPYDFVHKIAVNPANGDVYVSGHRRVLKSTNGGASFTQVFGSAVTSTAETGQTDIAIAPGKIIIAGNGANPDPALRGVFISNTGDNGSFTRIAGGSVLNTDSIANWRGNSYNGISKRILIALAPSNQNILYVLYENGLSNASPDLKPEVDFFKLDMTGGIFSWTNRSANMPDFPGGNNSGTDPISVQGGYDMLISVKPDNENIVFVGGSSLYRSTDAFATANYDNTLSWIGGYGRNSTTSLSTYANSHADIHNLVFNPANPNEAICANDGGLQLTSNIMAPSSATAILPWTMVSKYQTLQYYNVSIDPVAGNDNFFGGAQDNGSYFRDKIQLLGTAPADSNNHIRILGGDGCYTGMSPVRANQQFLYTSFQLGTIYRFKLAVSPAADNITPTGLTQNATTTGEFGEFVTNLRLNPDNTDQLYYVNFNRLFRTTDASTVTSSSWTELTGVSTAVNPGNPSAGKNIGIRALAFSRGIYTTSHVMYIGTTNGKIFRLNDPKNSAAVTAPVDITPPSLTGNVQDMAVNPNDDNEVLAVISNYNTVSIWWTNNAKAASPVWKNAEGNLTLPSARSCAIVVKKDAANTPVTEYYVGTSVGLYSTVNIGTGTPSWQREGGNVLNYSVVQSLAYKPVDNTLVIGTHGNGMFYTKLGTPNLTTGTTNPPDPNNKIFIQSVYPTLANGPVQYIIGNRSEITTIIIQLYTISGQELMRKETGYQNGSVDLSIYPHGTYLLKISSADNKYKQIQKIIH